VPIFVFVLSTAIFGILRLVIYRWIGLENTFPTVYYTPTIVLKLHLKKEKRKICSRLVVVNQGGQNNRNGNLLTLIMKELNFIVEQGRVVTTSNLIKH
jgi:hypothetical protein